VFKLFDEKILLFYYKGMVDIGSNLLDIAEKDIYSKYGIPGNYRYNFFPFPGVSSFGEIPGNYRYNFFPFPDSLESSNQFGKKKSRSGRKRVGWCLKKNRVVGVYSGVKGVNYYSNGKKIHSGKKVFKNKREVKKA